MKESFETPFGTFNFVENVEEIFERVQETMGRMVCIYKAYKRNTIEYASEIGTFRMADGYLHLIIDGVTVYRLELNADNYFDDKKVAEAVIALDEALRITEVDYEAKSEFDDIYNADSSKPYRPFSVVMTDLLEK